MSQKPALGQQVAGNHYRNMKIQPMEFSMANGWDACAHTALKYLSRYPNKGGVEDLRKAEHTVRLRQELGGVLPYRASLITAQEYCAANDLNLQQTAMIALLERIVNHCLTTTSAELLRLIRHVIEDLEDERINAIGQNGNGGEHYPVLKRKLLGIFTTPLEFHPDGTAACISKALFDDGTYREHSLTLGAAMAASRATELAEIVRHRTQDWVHMEEAGQLDTPPTKR